MIRRLNFLEMNRSELKKAYIAAIRAQMVGDITGCGFEVVDATAGQQSACRKPSDTQIIFKNKKKSGGRCQDKRDLPIGGAVYACNPTG